MPIGWCGTSASGGRIPPERPPGAAWAAMMGGMAGLEGMEQPRRHVSATAARWSPAVEDERALKALELFGNPTEAEEPLPSRPESAATARRLAQVVVLREWCPSPKMTEDAVLLVSDLVGNAVRHTGALVFGLRIRRRRGWI